MRYMRKLHPDLDILVSNIGEVFLPATKGHQARWTFGTKNSLGYMVVCIEGKKYLVHRLVAETFIPNPENKTQVDHISRQKDQNSVDCLRWATPSENQRNTPQHDRVTEQGRTHYYEDKKQAKREADARYRAENGDKVREQKARYRAANSEKIQRWGQSKRKTHRRVQFSDGTHHWLPLPEADAYIIIPLKERNYGK